MSGPHLYNKPACYRYRYRYRNRNRTRITHYYVQDSGGDLGMLGWLHCGKGRRPSDNSCSYCLELGLPLPFYFSIHIRPSTKFDLCHRLFLFFSFYNFIS